MWGSSWPRDQTQVSCIASQFFTIWVTREAANICGLAGNVETGASEKEFINMVKSVIHSLRKVLYFKNRLFASPYKLTQNSVDCPDQKVADPASRASLYLSWDTVCTRCSFVCLKDRELDFTELPWTGCMTIWMLLWLLINQCLYEWQNSVWDLLLR